jgi:dipeptidyl-peptidase 4
MKKISWLLIAVFAFSAFVRAQDKMLSIDDIFDPQRRVAFGGRPTFVQWNADGTLRQVKFNPATSSAEVVRVIALTGAEQPFIDKGRLEAALVPAGISAQTAREIANQPNFIFSKGEASALIVSGGDLYVYDLRGGTVKRLTDTKEAEKEADFSPDGRMVSFVRGNNLFVVEIASGREKQLTRDGDEKILNGVLDWVYEEELYGRGNKRGYWWSPDSRFIAFLRTDESPVPKFPIVDHSKQPQDLEMMDYPKAGDPNPLVTLGIADVTKTSFVPNVTRLPRVGNRVPPGLARFGDLAKFVDTAKYNAKDFLISRVAWTPDSKNVIFQAQDREQTFLDLNSADVSSGKFTTLFRESSPAWVEVIDNPEFLKDGSFIWQSARSGYKHLYHYDKNGRLIKQLTDGRWEVRSFYGADETGGFAYFSAAGQNDVWNAEQIYRVKLDGTNLTQLTKTAGNHSASFNPTFTHFVGYRSDASTPTQTALYRADGTLERMINENRVEALSQYKLGKTEFMSVRTRDGFEMEAMMIKPPDFDPNKKYPVMIYTYAGPHAPSVRNAFGGARYMWHQMLAQKGYIVWICDNRTASGKGEQATWKAYQNLGELELRDIEEGVDFLRAQPYIDASRIGIWGWSYGGYMTSYALTHSKSFKIGIAGGSVTDWRLYDSIYTERYMRTPQNNPAGYDRSSVLKAAKNLSGRLLLIHGTMDDNVHMQNTIQLAHELQKAGKQFDLMLYPTQRHGIVNLNQQKHMYQMMTDFILKNL